MLIDTHCHLADPAFDGDRPEVVARSRAAGVEHVVVVGDSLETSEQALALARQWGWTATAGVHPHAASTWNPDAAARLEALLDHPEVAAVGETGLDYHYEYSPRPDQRRAFEAQLALAARRRKPVVVHAREADDDLCHILAAYAAEVPAVVLHSFSSGPRALAAGLERGAYFSFSGMVTFKNWRLQHCVLEVPQDRLLVETDAPYLAPVPYRGRRNEPAFVAAVAARLAELRRVPFETLAAQSSENACRCFGLRLHPHSQPQ
jgi:TatD DNase family protein